MQSRNSTGDSFFAWEGDILVVNSLGKPRGTQLKVSVSAAPVAGKATQHMLRFLAPLFGVPVAHIEVVFDHENVNKQLRIRRRRSCRRCLCSHPGWLTGIEGAEAIKADKRGYGPIWADMGRSRLI